MTAQTPLPASTVETARLALKTHGRSFHFASHLLGVRHAARGARLYAFCRRLDDLADEAPDAQQARQALSAARFALNTGYSNDPVVTDFIDLAAETRLPLTPALQLVDGLEQDLGTVAVRSQAELVRYAYMAAGTVGLMMCAVLDTHDPHAAPHAIDLGIAMQLTNIARDIGEDARMGRRYVPGPWVDDAEPAAIVTPSLQLQSKLKAATQRLLALAERYYASGEAGLHHLPPRARLAILVASRVYRAIGDDIAAHDYRSWDRRAHVNGPRKVRLALGAARTFFGTDQMKAVAAPHDADLHRSLHALLTTAAAEQDTHVAY